MDQYIPLPLTTLRVSASNYLAVHSAIKNNNNNIYIFLITK